jgi:hypothetical protein
VIVSFRESRAALERNDLPAAERAAAAALAASEAANAGWHGSVAHDCRVHSARPARRGRRSYARPVAHREIVERSPGCRIPPSFYFTVRFVLR